MKKTSRVILRITTKMKDEIKKISDDLGFKETDITRYLLNSAIQKIKSDSIEAGGYSNLVITLKKT